MIKRLRLGKQYWYETLFKHQDTRIIGKPGVILAELGMPEDYDFEFYKNYMQHLFRYVLPFFVRGIVLADRGIALVDPGNPLARESFKPRQLVDCHGSFTNREGKSYGDCEVSWRPPGMKGDPWDHGYFLYKGEGKAGAPDVCQKIGAKVVGWYYGSLIPEKKVPWRYQLQQVYNEAVAELKQRFPQAEFRPAYNMYPASMRQAVEDLLAAGCQTILYQSFSYPVYSDFEDYAFALPLLNGLVNGRSKLVFADQLGNQPAMREAYLRIIQDRLAELPPQASVFTILSAHGHPFKQETLDARASEYRDPLTDGVRQLLKERGGRWDVTWSFDEFADPHWDPHNRKQSTFDAYRRAIAESYDYAVEVPTESPAESTDLMIFHAMRKFTAFSDYDRYQPIPYPDWDQPLVRTFHENKTTGIYAGCPVGPYRRHVVEAVVNSIGDVLANGGSIEKNQGRKI